MRATCRALLASARPRVAARGAHDVAERRIVAAPARAPTTTTSSTTTTTTTRAFGGSPADSASASSESSSCARVKPGDHGLPIVYHPSYSKPALPTGHRFPMTVFKALYERLIREGVAVPGKNLFQPARAPSREELLAAHCETYVDAFCVGALDDGASRKIGLPWSEDLVERTLHEVSGTILTADLALTCGMAMNTAGGTHHAHRAHGSGFCILNDLAVTAKRVLQRGAVERVLIVDLDVHQGDGTAAIVEDDESVFVLDAHCADNFPHKKATASRDIALAKGTGDDAYMKAVEEGLREALEEFKPQLVLYDAGVDVHEADALGGLSLTDEGLIRREALVLDTVVGRGIPIAGFVGGGYDADVAALARRHAVLHHVAREIYESNRL